MALSLSTRNKANIKRFSDARGAIILCSSTGSTMGSWVELPYMASIEATREEDSSDQKDGSGAVVASDTTLSKQVFKFDSLESSKALLDLFDEAYGNYILAWFRRGLINGKNQEFVWSPMKVLGNHTLAMDDYAKIPITFNGQKNDAAIAVTSPASTLSWEITGWATSATVPAEKQRIVVETTDT